MIPYDRMDSIFEGFENRIAIGDLDDKVKDIIAKSVISEFGKVGGIVKAVNDEIGTVYFDIDSLDVESDGPSISAIADAGGTSPYNIAGWIKYTLQKLPAKDLGKYESVDVNMGPIRTDWTKIGKEYVKTDADTDKIVDEISKLEWVSFKSGADVGFSQGSAIKSAIKDLKIPNPDMYAIGGGFGLSGEPDASYGFYGIQANYSDVKTRIYLLDSGVKITPIAIEVFKK